MDKRTLWLWLTLNAGITRNKIQSMLSDMGTIEDIYEATPADYISLGYLDEASISRLSTKDTSNLADIESIMDKYKVRLLTVDMDSFPRDLLELHDYPVALYCRGKELDLNEHLCISVVGTRKPTRYGDKVATSMAREMASEGALIVSGMAEGIDACAHKGALDAGAPTVAILGCGVNITYPKKNASLMKRILENGMVISEYPFNAEPSRFHFPERNRIIAGLSKATLVVECEEKSGSLITANLAQEFNRDLFAVPGNIDQMMSKGTNTLLKGGAYVATSAEDVLSHYRDVYGYKLNPVVLENKIIDFEEEKPKAEENIISKKIDGLSDKEKILNCLGDEPIHIDVLCDMTGISVASANSMLVMLELEGKIYSYAGNMYSRKDI